MTPARCFVCGPDAEPHAPDSHGASATALPCTHARAMARAKYERAVAVARIEYKRALGAGVVCNTCGGSGVAR